VTELPRGTVTFLFTDIEGSTSLLKRLGRDRYGELLARQQVLLREAFASAGGEEVDTQGDSFFVAFHNASDAVSAAVRIQRSLADHEWPDGTQVRVRIGIHTGEAAATGERYVGFSVHRAARIGTVGHGGQVLLSSATRELLEDEVGGVSISDLGSYRLKDIDRPERLYQLVIEGLRNDFPPLNAEKAAEPRPLRRRSALLAALLGVIAAAVAIPIFAFGQGGGGGGGPPADASGSSLGVLDSGSGRLVEDIGVGATPTAVAAGEGAYWVANTDGNSVSKIDPETNAVVDTIANVGSSPSGVTTGNGAVWVANSLDGTVARIDPTTDTVADTIPVGNGPVGIVSTPGAVWVADTTDGTITKIDPGSDKRVKTLPVPATQMAYGGGSLWASQQSANQVVRIDPATDAVVQQVTVGNGPTGIAYGDGSVWVANSLDGTVSRIDPAANAVKNVVEVGDGPTSIAIDPKGVWVSNAYDGTLIRIDPASNRPGRPVHLGNRLAGVAAIAGNVLVSIDTESGAAHRGGTLVVRMDRPAKGSPIDSTDSAVAYSTTDWLILRLTGDGLVGFNHVSGAAGNQLVPDLAVSLPTPTDGGRTYTFTLRKGIRYSNGTLLRPADFVTTFRRAYALGTPVSFYDGIVGAAACEKHPKTCDLSRGIVPDDRAGTVTFHLVAPDAEFLVKLSMPFAFAVPAGTPLHLTGTRPLPATGPYTIARFRPKSTLELVRNPNFHERSQAAQPDGYPDRIVARIGGTADGAIADVLSGSADVLWTSEPQTPIELNRIATLHPSQVHSNPQPSTQALFLNTRVPPFGNLDVRRAVNYAVDRRAALAANGGPLTGQPTCQILPRGFPGYQPYCPYTTGSATVWSAPDLPKARALVARSGTRGMKVTLWAWDQATGFNTVAASALRSLGYRVTVKTVGSNYFSEIGDSRLKAAIGFMGWTADYPTASDFLHTIFTCASFVPARALKNTNFSEFCDPAIDRQIERALALQVANPAAGRDLWARIDRAVVDEAPWVPLVNTKSFDVVSKRVGNYQYNPALTTMMLDQLWVR
jgi:YVTN family beta-propeller protein